MLTAGGATSKFPMLSLKASAYCDAFGTIIKQQNVASITRSTAGVYAVVFTVAMADANFFIDLKFNWRGSSGSATPQPAMSMTAVSAAGFQLNLYNITTAQDWGNLYMEVYD